MPYIGKNPVGGGFHKLDALTASATATYALTLNSAAYYPESANQLLVSLNGVIQAPQDSFTVSGSNLVFDTALTASDSIDFVVALGDVLAVQTVTDGAITTAKLGNGAVTSAKLDTNIAVSGNLDVGTIRDAAGTNTAMTIDSTGRILTPARPAFKAFKSGGAWQSFGSTNRTLMPFDSTSINVGSCYDTTNYKFVAPVSGLYYVNFQWYTDDNASEAFIFKNSETNPEAYGTIATQASTIQVSTLLELTANDEIKVYGEVGATNSDDWFAREDYSFFEGYLIG